VLVARIIGILDPGGAQLSAFRLSRALARHGVETRLLAGDASPAGHAQAREHGFEVEAVGGMDGLQWTPSPSFAEWLAPRIAGADLVHAHMFGAWWAAAQVIADDVPLVASEHNTLTWPGRPHAAAMRRTLPRVDRFFAHGPAALAYVRALGMDPRRLVAGTSSIAGTGVRALAGLPVPRIVQASRLAPDKGPDVLVDALALLEDAPPAYIVGDGRMRPELEARVRALGIGDRVTFPGWQHTPGRWVAGASVYVVPSREEAFSQSAVLAMALGVPVVGTAVEALPEVLGDGRGILVAPEDPEALAQAIAGVLAGRLRPDLDAARRYAARFQPARVARAYLRHYRAVLAERRNSAFSE
jgi:glycosyltransferase involved in cell wall biosynthesis